MRTTARLVLATAIAATTLGVGAAHADTCTGAAPATDVGMYVCTTGEQDPYWKPVCVHHYYDTPVTGALHNSICGP